MTEGGCCQLKRRAKDIHVLLSLLCRVRAGEELGAETCQGDPGPN